MVWLYKHVYDHMLVTYSLEAAHEWSERFIEMIPSGEDVSQCFQVWLLETLKYSYARIGQGDHRRAIHNTIQVIQADLLCHTREALRRYDRKKVNPAWYDELLVAKDRESFNNKIIMIPRWNPDSGGARLLNLFAYYRKNRQWFSK